MRGNYFALIAIILVLFMASCVMPTTDMAGGEMAEDGMDMPASPEMTEGELTVANVRANLTLPTPTGSVWLYIMNGTDTDDALIGAEVPGCGVIELHDMVMEGDMMKMFPVEGGQIAVPAGETVELKQGGLHIMCIEKEAPLELGTSVDMVLHFANAGDIPVTGEVVAPNMEMMKKMQGAGHDMDEGDHGEMEEGEEAHGEMDDDSETPSD